MQPEIERVIEHLLRMSDALQHNFRLVKKELEKLESNVTERVKEEN